MKSNCNLQGRLTWMPRPFAGTNASTVREKSAPANFSFSVLVPCTAQAGDSARQGVKFHGDGLCVVSSYLGSTAYCHGRQLVACSVNGLTLRITLGMPWLCSCCLAVLIASGRLLFTPCKQAQLAASHRCTASHHLAASDLNCELSENSIELKHQSPALTLQTGTASSSS